MTTFHRVRLAEWRTAYYTGTTKPALATLKRRIDQHILPGSSASGEYIVYCDANYEPIHPPNPPTKSQPVANTGNKLADAILQRHRQPELAEA